MLRLVDANLNRAREGLRLLEDVARFVLNDAGLSQTLKDLRHQMAKAASSDRFSLLTARDSTNDVGSEMRPAADLGRSDLPALITANARRVEESLRVLEEATRTPGFEGVDWQAFQSARFALYELEKQLVSAATRQAIRRRVSGLYLVLDTEWLKGRTEVAVARQAVSGGASMLQLRDKRRGARELLPVARELKAVCEAYGALFVMNDFVDLALSVGADCLHLGQSDLPLDVARKVLPIDMLVGGSTHSTEQAVDAAGLGADYIAVGAIYPTQSKHSITIVGTQTLKKVRSLVKTPLVAIGGITKDNAGQVMAAGADAVAVISAVMGADDIEKATREIVNAIRNGKETGEAETANG